MKKNIHIAITRKVKPAFENAFKTAILDFFTTTVGLHGSLGARLICPAPGSHDNTYGILRSFDSEEERDAFYQSASFLEWEKIVQPVTENHYSRNDLHGLGAFSQTRT